MTEGMRFVGPYDRALFLRTLAPLQKLGPDEFATFAEFARECRFRPGAAILREGEPVPGVHIIVEGSVRVRGVEHRTLMGSGEGFGFLEMLAQTPEGVDATAEDDTLTLELERDVLMEMFEESTPTFVRLMRTLAQQTLDERREIPDGAYLAPAEGLYPPSGRDIDLVERVLTVRRPGGPFERASVGAIVDLTAFGREQIIPAGTTLWSTGDRGTDAYMLQQGTVLCTTRGGLSRFRCGPGYPLGNLERMCDQPRWYTAVTETEVVAFRSDLDTFFDVVEDHPQMATQFATVMARNLLRLLSTSTTPAP